MGLSQHYINIYTEFKVSLINLLEDFSLRIFMGLSDTSGEVWVISKDENRRALFIYTSQEVAISTSNQDLSSLVLHHNTNHFAALVSPHVTKI